MVRRWARAVWALAAGVLCVAALGLAPGIASARSSGYFVTLVARSCPDYADVFANRARNDILESLRDLGPDTQYGGGGQLINPDSEGIPPQDRCVPLPGWEFALGRSYESRAVSGPWGSLSKVTQAFPRAPVVTRNSTPLLDQDAAQVGDQTIAGATTIELTPEERAQAERGNQLWVQGGTQTDPVLAQKFPGPEYGFAALRCATDNLNGDNVEYVFFPAGVRHVFCYGLYVKPPPTAGTITIEKRVSGAPEGDNVRFPYNGSISFDPDGFQLGNNESKDFYRGGGSTWTVTEGKVDNYRLDDLSCRAVAPGGGAGTSRVDITGGTVAVALVARDHVTCTYSNRYVPPTGGLTIRKITKGGVGRFGYTVTPVSGDGRTRRAAAVTTDPGVVVDAHPAPLQLAPGRYRIRERSPPSTPDGRWRLRDIRCNGDERSLTRPLEITVESGAGVTCTWVNRFVPRGSISISKVTTGGTGTASFLVEPVRGPPAQYLKSATTETPGVAAAARPKTPADATDHLRLNGYRIVEQLPPSGANGHWELTAVECDGELVPFDQGTVNVRLTRSDPHTHCVFTDALVTGPAPPPVPPVDPPPVRPPPNPVFPEPGRPAYELANLVVTKRADTPSVRRGGVVSYRITVTNRGPDRAESVVLDDEPLGRARLVSVSGGRGRCQPLLPTLCRLGTIKPGARVTVTVRLRASTRARILVNRAVVGSATQERRLADNRAAAGVRVRRPPRFTG